VGDVDKAKSEFETGRWSKAYKLFQKALAGRNDSSREVAEVRVLMARCLAQMGEPEKAETQLKELQPRLTPSDKELLREFENAWREVEDTRKLNKTELERKRAEARAQKN
jgi:thioredoxin-like negative regulator of GroEL